MFTANISAGIGVYGKSSSSKEEAVQTLIDHINQGRAFHPAQDENHAWIHHADPSVIILFRRECGEPKFHSYRVRVTFVVA